MSGRLRFLFSKARPGGPFWDVGCDHGYLGEMAHRSGFFSHVHFVDPVESQIQKLQNRLGSNEGLSFHAKPAEHLDQVIEGQVTMAGMGADLMLRILSAWKNKDQLQAQRLILSPHKDAQRLGETLFGYRLGEKTEIQEKGRFRPVFCFDSFSIEPAGRSIIFGATP